MTNVIFCQEVEEYVITREIERELKRLVEGYKEAIFLPLRLIHITASGFPGTSVPESRTS